MAELNWKALELVDKFCVTISKVKNKLYGSHSLTHHGGFGIWVRITDKFTRIDKYYSDGAKKNNWDELEAVEDSILDMINYLKYLYLLQHGLLIVDNDVAIKDIETKMKVYSDKLR